MVSDRNNNFMWGQNHLFMNVERSTTNNHHIYLKSLPSGCWNKDAVLICFLLLLASFILLSQIGPQWIFGYEPCRPCPTSLTRTSGSSTEWECNRQRQTALYGVENTIKLDDLDVPPFQETSICLLDEFLWWTWTSRHEPSVYWQWDDIGNITLVHAPWKDCSPTGS